MTYTRQKLLARIHRLEQMRSECRECMADESMPLLHRQGAAMGEVDIWVDINYYLEQLALLDRKEAA